MHQLPIFYGAPSGAPSKGSQAFSDGVQSGASVNFSGGDHPPSFDSMLKDAGAIVNGKPPIEGSNESRNALASLFLSGAGQNTAALRSMFGNELPQLDQEALLQQIQVYLSDAQSAQGAGLDTALEQLNQLLSQFELQGQPESDGGLQLAGLVDLPEGITFDAESKTFEFNSTPNTDTLNELLVSVSNVFPSLEGDLNRISKQIDADNSVLDALNSLEELLGDHSITQQPAAPVSASGLGTTAIDVNALQKVKGPVQATAAAASQLNPMSGSLDGKTRSNTQPGVVEDFDGLILDSDKPSGRVTQSPSDGSMPLKAQLGLNQADQNFRTMLDQTAGNLIGDVSADSADEGLVKSELAAAKTAELQSRSMQANTKPYTTTLQTPVSDPDWSNQVNEKIMWLSSRNIQSAQIHLNPAELGPIDVKVSVQNDQTVVSFNVQNTNVRDLLEANVQRLRDMLDSNGAEQASVNVDSGDAGEQGFSFASGDQSNGDSNQSSGGQADLSETVVAETSISSAQNVNLVDFYA